MMAEVVQSRPKIELLQWRTSYDFIGMCMCNFMSLARVWNFQHLVYRNGGGAFIIPYSLCFLCLAAPIMLLEFALGQFSKSSPLMVWEFCPILSGSGFVMVIVSGIAGIFYAMFIAWGFYFLYTCIPPDVPWIKCGDWSTPHCIDNVKIVHRYDCLLLNGSINSSGICSDHIDKRRTLVWNIKIATSNGFHTFNAAEEYFERVILGDPNYNIHNLGEVRIQPVLGLMATWILVWLLMIKGIHVIAKPLIWSMIIPATIFTAIFIKGLTLDGAWEGVLFYILPDMQKITKLKIWKDAAIQVFWTSGAAYGQMISLSRYNQFNDDILGNILIMSVANLVCNILVGVCIFSYIGFLTKLTNSQMNSVVEEGPVMPFKVLPSAFSVMAGAHYWGAAFEVMVIFCGIVCELLFVETVISSIIDFKPQLRKQRAYILSGLCFASFILGIPLTTKGGRRLVELMFFYTAGLNLLMVALCELFAVGWIYGANRLMTDLNFMIGRRCCVFTFSKMAAGWFKICWMVISPGCIFFIILLPSDDFSTSKPLWALVLSNCLTSIAIVGIVVVACFKIYRSSGTCKQRLTQLSTPSKTWESALTKQRQEIRRYMSDLLIYIDQQQESEAVPDEETTRLNVDTDHVENVAAEVPREDSYEDFESTKV